MVKPKLLLDENIGYLAVLNLRKDGYDVASILEESPGATDQEVIRRARSEERIIVTLDKDFGVLVYRDSSKHVGVLLLRIKKESAENISMIISKVLVRYGRKLKRKFTVATETRIRMRQ